MMLRKVFENFVNGSPVSVMLRAIMEHALSATEIDQLFTATAEQQYTRELLFSSLVDGMAEVVCRIRPSIHAGYQADGAAFTTSRVTPWNCDASRSSWMSQHGMAIRRSISSRTCQHECGPRSSPGSTRSVGRWRKRSKCVQRPGAGRTDPRMRPPGPRSSR